MDEASTTELVDLHLPIPGHERTIPIAVDTARIVSVNTHKLTLVGGQGAVHVAVDRYPCRDGSQECYVRVLDLRAEAELWYLLVRSDHHAITCADPEVSWSEDRRGFTVNLTSAAPLTVLLSEVGGATVLN